MISITISQSAYRKLRSETEKLFKIIQQFSIEIRRKFQSSLLVWCRSCETNVSILMVWMHLHHSSEDEFVKIAYV